MQHLQAQLELNDDPPSATAGTRIVNSENLVLVVGSIDILAWAG